jgi:membrane-anchored glycerophosphoryl diester phosphodiesterase (GDPDase)
MTDSLWSLSSKESKELVEMVLVFRSIWSLNFVTSLLTKIYIFSCHPSIIDVEDFLSEDKVRNSSP